MVERRYTEDVTVTILVTHYRTLKDRDALVERAKKDLEQSLFTLGEGSGWCHVRLKGSIREPLED